MDLELTGKQALVCGASAGIGRAAALALARLGASVSVLARSREKLEPLVEELRFAGAQEAHAIVADMEIRPLLRRKVEERLGQVGGTIHVLVNNSGGPPSGPILEAEEDEFLKAFGRHVLSAHLLARLLLPGMKKAGWGRIVNVLSTTVREPIVGLGVSNTTRGAMASWAKSVSKELPAGITINNVLPGYTATGRLQELANAMAERSGRLVGDVEADWIRSIPEGRLGRPEELGEVIAFLCSPAAAYIRGQSLAVDGGRLSSI